MSTQPTCRVIIAGGRNKRLEVHEVINLQRLLARLDPGEVVTGGCSTGVDSEAAVIARSMGISVRIFYADWQAHGKKAGPIRNAEMAQYGTDLILFDGGRGTESMLREAGKAGLNIYDFRTQTP